MAGAVSEIQPGANSGHRPMEHPGEELVLVIDGVFELDVDGERFLLEQGDAPLPDRPSAPAGTTPATSPRRPSGSRCGRSDPLRARLARGMMRVCE